MKRFIVLGLIFVVFIYFLWQLVFGLGCFNNMVYQSRYNRHRAEVGLHPFIKGWEHKKMHGAEWWFNPEEPPQGLFCWYKQQWFFYESLDLETDAWKYSEGDSVRLLMFHSYYFNPNSTRVSAPRNTRHSFSPDTSVFLHRYGQSLGDSATFARTLDFLKHREDALHLRQ